MFNLKSVTISPKTRLSWTFSHNTGKNCSSGALGDFFVEVFSFFSSSVNFFPYLPSMILDFRYDSNFFDFSLRSSRLEVSCTKGVLRNFAKFTGKHLCQSIFFNKIAGLGLQIKVYKKPFSYRPPPVTAPFHCPTKKFCFRNLIHSVALNNIYIFWSLWI